MIETLFLDTDCLSTFLVVRRENLITRLYHGRIGIPRQVYLELRKAHFLMKKVNDLVQRKLMPIYSIEMGTESADLYQKMISKPDRGYLQIGSGEAAAIVLTKQNNGILGSNNMSDVKQYITRYNLKHRTSADILKEALSHRLINEGQGNALWKEMLNRNRKLPCSTFSEFLER